jgi:hypothetical protein
MRTDFLFSGWIAVIAVATVFANSTVAQGDHATQPAMIAKWAGSYNTEGFLNEPAVRGELQKLLGAELDHLFRNLNVRGAVDLDDETLSISGNAPHQGTEEEAIVCTTVLSIKTIVEAGIFSKGAITVYSREKQYVNASICIKDWITQVNSGHKDRFVKPANVWVTTPPP